MSPRGCGSGGSGVVAGRGRACADDGAAGGDGAGSAAKDTESAEALAPLTAAQKKAAQAFAARKIAKPR